MKDKQKKMTLQQFSPWLHEKAGAEIKTYPGRTDCVVNINHIEPGYFAVLFACDTAEGLAVAELAEHYGSEAAAWEALANDAEAFSPVLFEDWVTQQYLTDREATVERFEI